MNTFKNILFAGAILAAMLLAPPIYGQQTTLTTTTTSAAIAATDKVVCLTSATGVTVPTTGVGGSTLFIGGLEQVIVQSVTDYSATCFNVRRASRPIAHATSAAVYIGSSNNFYAYAPAGACTTAAMRVRPWINVATNNVYDCVSSVWTVINGPATQGTGLSSLGPVAAGTIDIGSALLPFRKMYLGTAATNNMVITPAATAAARVITMSDPGGAATLAYTNPTTAQTITNTTLTTPTLTTPTVNAGIYTTDIARSSAQFDAVTGTTGTTLTNITGMVLTVVPGTYRFYINLPMVTTANAGIKTGFKLTGTVLTSIDYTSRLYVAAGVAVQHGTTTADQTAMAALTAAATISTVIEGTMVVGTGGTMQLQAAQNAAHVDTLSVYVGASMQFTRIN